MTLSHQIILITSNLKYTKAKILNGLTKASRLRSIEVEVKIPFMKRTGVGAKDFVDIFYRSCSRQG